MAKKRVTSRSAAKVRREAAEMRETYDGHEIVIARDDPACRVLVDGEPIRYGRIGDQYYLEVYAYDRDASLVGVVKRYIDYRKQAVSRHAAEPGR
jgi:hypothetical protein